MVLPAPVALGLFSQSVFVGGNVGVSGIAIPAIRNNNVPGLTQAKQFGTVYDKGAKYLGGSSVVSSLLYLYGSFDKSITDTHQKVLWACSAAAFTAMPITLLLILPSVKKIKQIASQSTTDKEAEDQDVGQLIDKWNVLSIVRAVANSIGFVTYLTYLVEYGA